MSVNKDEMNENTIYLSSAPLPAPVNKITVYGDVLEINDDNNVLVNGKEVETIEDTKEAIAILIKALCGTFS